VGGDRWKEQEERVHQRPAGAAHTFKTAQLSQLHFFGVLPAASANFSILPFVLFGKAAVLCERPGDLSLSHCHSARVVPKMRRRLTMGCDFWRRVFSLTAKEGFASLCSNWGTSDGRNLRSFGGNEYYANGYIGGGAKVTFVKGQKIFHQRVIIPNTFIYFNMLLLPI